MTGVARDLGYALRSLVKNPLPTTAAVIALGLGLGATTTVFSVVKGVLLSPLPYPDPDRLAVVWETQRERGSEERYVAPAKVEALRKSGIFEHVSAFAPVKLALTGEGEPLEVRAHQVTPGFFETLGVRVARGRSFRPDEAAPGQSDVVILSDGLWRRRYGADPRAVGTTVTLDARPFEVVGIAAEEVGPFGHGDLWIPLALDSWQSRVARFLHVIARLPEGRSPDEARAGVARLSAELALEHPETDRGWSIRIVDARDQVVSKFRPTLWVLFAAVLLVLLVACANVSTLLLARGAARGPELAIRKSLGAGRGALARLVILDAFCLAVGGGALGILLAVGTLKMALAVAPGDLPALDRIAVDLGSVAFALASASGAALLTALWPGFQSWRTEVRDTVQVHLPSTGTRRRCGAGFGRLVSAQIALALVLLAGAGLMIKSFARLQDTDLGFDPRGLTAAPLTLPRSSYASGVESATFVRELLDRLGRNPSVAEVAASSKLPLSGETAPFRFLIEGDPREATAELPTADYEVVSPGYFRTMRTPLLAGRDLAHARRRIEPEAVVVNRAMARRYWPDLPLDPSRPQGGGPLGERISVDGPDGPWLTIVGVVEDVRRSGPDQIAEPAFYASFEQDPWPAMSIVVRARSAGTDLGAVVRQTVWSLDPDLPVPEVFRVEDRFVELLARPRFVLLLLTALGLIALVLASVGLYGVMAYTVSLMRPEIALRMSLGAERGTVLRQVLGGATKLAAAGISIGLAASWATTRFLQSLLFEVGSTDLEVLAAVSVLLAGTALSAAALPAMRASRVDPAKILRA